MYAVDTVYYECSFIDGCFSAVSVPTVELFYRLAAYGRDFHFNLTRNDRLTAPSLVVEHWSRDGAVRRLAEVTSRRCHYVGHIAGEEKTSSVAFSNCFGLVGVG